MAEKVILDSAWAEHPVAQVVGRYQRVESLVRGHAGFMDRSTSKCYRMELAGLPMYVKYYQRVHEKEGLRFRHFRLSRPMREWRNIALFQRLGIATTPPVAVGESRRFGLFRSGYIVTLEIADAQEFSVLAAKSPERVRDVSFFEPLCAMLAEAIGKLHAMSFFHNDLNGRNVLVRTSNGVEAFLIDSPNGRRWLFPFREFRLIKDLAALDSAARQVLSRGQRLRFYLAYARRTRLTRADKRRLQRILARSAAPLKPLNPDVKSYIE